jgi:hypothetical protein
VSGNLEGTPFAENRLLGWALSKIDDVDGRRALTENTPEFVAQKRAQMKLDSSLIDVAYGAAHGGGIYSEPLFDLTGNSLGKKMNAVNDGVITTVDPIEAKKVIVDETPKTHLMVWKDWRTVDAIVAGLNS